MTEKNLLRRFLACTSFAVVCAFLLSQNARAERAWEDTYRAKLWPTSYSACLDGEALSRIGDLKRANPTLNYRHRSLNVNEYLEDEEALCRYVIERSLGSRWVTVEIGSRTHFAVGSVDPCAMGPTDSSGHCLPKSAGKPCPPCNGSNPINGGTGNKFQEERDYLGAAAFPLLVQRYYNSLSRERGPLGLNWRHFYQRRVLTIEVTAEVPSRVRLYRHDGQRYEFSLVGTVWVPDGDVNFRLAPTATTPIGWTVTTPSDEVEQYDFEGQLVSIKRRNGQRHTLTYDYSSAAAGGRLKTVTDQDGRTLQFAYDANDRISTVTLPNAAESVTYSYDASGRLASVTYPNSTSRTYHYNETAYVTSSQPTALTGITDEDGTRFAYFYYDAQGRGTRSEHAGSVDGVTIAYGSSMVHTATDALGTSRTFSFTRRGGTRTLPTGISKFCSNCGTSNASVLDFDTNANITLRRDFRGVDTTYGYDTTRNLETTRTEALGTPSQRIITTTWHPTYRLQTQVDEPNRRTTFTHDASGNVLTETVTDLTSSPNVSRTWTFTYNSVGRVLTADGPRTDVADLTTYTYYNCTTGNECGQVQTVTNARGQTTTYGTYNAHGQPLTATDANGVQTTFAYDARQRLVLQTAATETTAYEYWPMGLLKKITLPDGSYVRSTYDGAHRLIKIEDDEGNRVEYTLDKLGNRTSESSYDPSGALARTYTQAFNSLGQLWKQSGAAGTPEVTTVLGYDDNGNRTAVGAPLGRASSSQYDELNRRAQVTDPASGVTQYGYDTHDNITAVTDPRGLATTYNYNGLNEIISLNSPDTGTSLYTYDAAGNLKTTADARSRAGNFSYDELNRLTSIAYADRTISFTYDAGANGIGRLTGASDANHSIAWTYDPLGRVIGKGQTVGTITHSVGYAYLQKNLASLVTPSGQAITFGYANGRISSIAVNGISVVRNVRHDPFGPVSGWTWGNGTLAVRVYDEDGNPTIIQSAADVREYAYDDAFRVTSLTDPSDAANSWTYSYDLLDRLNAASSAGQAIGYTYDANGNRLTQTGAQAATYTVPTASNRLMSVSGALTRTYTYDAAGNVSDYGGTSFTYSDAGRLTSVTNAGVTATYVFDALSQRVKKTTGSDSRYFVYDEGGHLVGEYDSTGALIQETVWLHDIPVATLRPIGASIEIYYVHSDHLNAPRRVSRPSDNVVVWQWNSNPFGSSAANENPDGDSQQFTYNLRFPGQYYDAESGLSYNYARNYDAAIGRYVESDPVGLEGGINTYAYVGNSPQMYSDPLGLWITPMHRRMSSEAAAAAGCGSAAGDLGRLTAEVDTEIEGSQKPENSIWHGMRDGINNQTVEEAQAAYEEYVAENSASCEPAKLARALHAVQDSYSPAHRGFKKWKGIWRSLPSLPLHVLQDTFAHPGTYQNAVADSAAIIAGAAARCECLCSK